MQTKNTAGQRRARANVEKPAEPAVKRRRIELFLLPGHKRRIFNGESSQVVSRAGETVIVRESTGKPVSVFDLSEQIAKECREDGRPIDEHTQRWIEVPYWTEEQERKETQELLRPNDDPWGPARLSCRVLLNGSVRSAATLGAMADECLRQLQDAATKASECDLMSAHASIAVEQLARVIGHACSEMNELARKHPRIFHRFTRKGFWKWPVMKSTYPDFGDDESALFAGLQLGRDLPLRLDRKAQWARTVNDEPGRIAWHLLWYLWHARSENNHFGFDYGHFGEKADALPALDKKSAPQWWAVAKEVLLFSYPKPLEVPELATVVKKRKDRYPSRRLEALLNKLESRFLSLARVPLSSPT